MKIKFKCVFCLKEDETKVSFRHWFQHLIGTDKINNSYIQSCPECDKALLQIGLARFSNITLEVEQQKNKWIEFRDKLNKGVF